MELTATVVGGGLAGLASAISLAQAGWRTTVLERSPDLGEVGAGVAMSRNAEAAFRTLGFGDDDVARLGPATWAGGTWDLHGGEILRIPGTPEVRRAVGVRGVHRRRLHGALLEAALATGVELVTSARVTHVETGAPGGAPAVVGAGSERWESDLVVGADGVRSAVRAAVFPASRPVYSGYSSWRAVVPQAAPDEFLRQVWGPHAEFGVMPLGEAETYWYGYVRLSERTVLDDELAAARERFAGWAPPVRDLVDATPASAVMRHDVHYLPGGLPRYVVGRLVMVGDAAHATLPTMGQGAATALEDGVSVGRLVGARVRAGEDLSAALTAFDAARRPRCRAIGRASLQSGRFGSHLGPRWQGARNALMRLTPPSLLIRGADAVMGWTPPD